MCVRARWCLTSCMVVAAAALWAVLPSVEVRAADGDAGRRPVPPAADDGDYKDAERFAALAKFLAKRAKDKSLPAHAAERFTAVRAGAGIRFGYRPPEESDVQLDFTRTADGDDLQLFLPTRAGVKAYVDGKLVAAEPFDPPPAAGAAAPPESIELTLENSPSVFHAIGVREVTGKGQLTRK